VPQEVEFRRNEDRLAGTMSLPTILFFGKRSAPKPPRLEQVREGGVVKPPTEGGSCRVGFKGFPTREAEGGGKKRMVGRAERMRRTDRRGTPMPSKWKEKSELAELFFWNEEGIILVELYLTLYLCIGISDFCKISK